MPDSAGRWANGVIWHHRDFNSTTTKTVISILLLIYEAINLPLTPSLLSLPYPLPNPTQEENPHLAKGRSPWFSG